MSTISHSERPTNIPSSVTDKLAALRRGIVGWLLVDGLAALAVAALGVFLIDLAVDWLFRMDLAQRRVCFVLMVAALAYVIYRRLLKPLGQSYSDDVLVLQVESKHRELGQSLISAVQFSRVEDQYEGLGMSSTMVRATIDQGTRAAGGVNFSDVLEGGRFRRNVAKAVGVVAFFVALGVFAPHVLSTWANRNIAFGDARWPQDTHLQMVDVEGAEIILPAGDDLRIVVEVYEGLVPDSVEIQYGAGRSARGESEMMPMDGVVPGDMVAVDATNKPRYEYTFKNVLEAFSIRARGGDGDTPWVDVRLVDRPAVDAMTLELTPPAYTRLKIAELARGQGPYEFYPGSKLAIRGTATKTLKSAMLRISRRGQPAESVPVAIDADNAQRFSVSLSPQQVMAANYELEVVDEVDRRSRRPEAFALKAVADRIPSVGAKLDGISSMIVPQAVVPIVITMSDDFAITKSGVAYRVKTTTDSAPGEAPAAKGDEAPAEGDTGDSPAGDESAPIAPGESPGAKLPEAGPNGDGFVFAQDEPPADAADTETPAKDDAPAIAFAERSGSIPHDELKDRYGSDKIEFRFAMEVAPIELAVGDDFEFHIEAVDNDTVSGPKTGKSHRFQLRVVTEEELRNDLLRREKDQRKQFEDLIVGQDDLVTETKALASEVRGRPDTPPESRESLLKAQKRQHQIGERCRTIAGWLDQIVLEAQNNRLEGPEGRYQREMRGKVIEPLVRLVDVSIPAAAQLVDDARRLPDGDSLKRDELLNEAVAAETRIAAEMKSILRYMVKAEGYQEAINLAYRILDVQGNLNAATRQMLRELIEGSGDK
ncbi:MAG: hypothetical protein WD875_18980 [Pirellulales bacterium]